MNKKAIIELYGILESDIMVETFEPELKYGLAIVSVSRKDDIKQIDVGENYKAYQFPVAIWDQVLLNTIQHQLKKGTRVLLKGEIKLFNYPLTEENTVNKNLTDSYIERMINIEQGDSLQVLDITGTSVEASD